MPTRGSGGIIKKMTTHKSPHPNNTIIGIILIVSFLLKMILFDSNVMNGGLNSYEYSEFLINYQGGFVRRGLIGEILYRIYLSHPFHVKGILLSVCCLIYLWNCLFFYRRFKKYDLCWWLLLSPLFLNFTTYIVRKDYLLYALLIAIVFLLRPSSRDILNKSIACLLVLISLLIHEAFLFWGVVLYAIVLLTDNRHKVLNYSFIAIPLIAVAIISHFKGSTEVAHTIVSSWNSIIPGSPLKHITYNSIGAIGWDTSQTCLMHLKYNISLSTHGGGIVLIPLMLIAAYYLFTNYMVYFNKGTVVERNAGRMGISLLFPVFCVSLIPMFTVLSCDTGRVFQYATITTFIAFLILPRQNILRMFPEWYKTAIGRFNNVLDRRFPATKSSLTFMLLVLAVSPCYFSLNESWNASIIGSIISNCLSICVKMAKIIL